MFFAYSVSHFATPETWSFFWIFTSTVRGYSISCSTLPNSNTALYSLFLDSYRAPKALSSGRLASGNPRMWRNVMHVNFGSKWATRSVPLGERIVDYSTQISLFHHPGIRSDRAWIYIWSSAVSCVRASRCNAWGKASISQCSLRYNSGATLFVCQVWQTAMEVGFPSCDLCLHSASLWISHE